METTYDTYGVSNHHGGLNGGHYTAFAKNRLDKSWYLFDDSSVSRVSQSDVCTSAAYVLFLHQQQTDTHFISSKSRLANFKIVSSSISGSPQANKSAGCLPKYERQSIAGKIEWVKPHPT